MMDQSLAEILGKLLAVLALVAANGFFVDAEFSPVGVRPSRIDELAAQGFDWAVAGDVWRFEVMVMDQHRIDEVQTSKTGA